MRCGVAARVAAGGNGKSHAVFAPLVRGAGQRGALSSICGCMRSVAPEKSLSRGLTAMWAVTECACFE
jgi:hypothetical protein